jgi:hypothetical protein
LALFRAVLVRQILLGSFLAFFGQFSCGGFAVLLRSAPLFPKRRVSVGTVALDSRSIASKNLVGGNKNDPA